MPVKSGTVRSVNFEFFFTRTENIFAVCSIVTPFFDEPISFLQICVSKASRGLALSAYEPAQEQRAVFFHPRRYSIIVFGAFTLTAGSLIFTSKSVAVPNLYPPQAVFCISVLSTSTCVYQEYSRTAPLYSNDLVEIFAANSLGRSALRQVVYVIVPLQAREWQEKASTRTQLNKLRKSHDYHYFLLISSMLTLVFLAQHSTGARIAHTAASKREDDARPVTESPSDCGTSSSHEGFTSDPHTA